MESQQTPSFFSDNKSLIASPNLRPRALQYHTETIDNYHSSLLSNRDTEPLANLKSIGKKLHISRGEMQTKFCFFMVTIFLCNNMHRNSACCFFPFFIFFKAPATFHTAAVTKKQKVSIRSITKTSTGRKYFR